jgi:putative membrane protein
MNPITRSTLIAVSFAGALALAQAGCGSDDNTKVLDGSVPGAGDGAATGMSSVPDAGLVSTMKLSDIAVAGVLTEDNNAEIMVGKVAMTSGKDMRVRTFAQQTVMDHSMASQRVMALIPKLGPGDGDSSVRQMLSTQATVTITDLITRTGAAFDTTYLNSRVAMNGLMLNALDSILIPSAQNAELKAELTTTRTMLMMHQSAAQTLSASLGADGGM